MYIRGIKSERYFNSIFYFSFSHKQSPDVVREKSTCKFYTYFLTVVRAMSTLVEFDIKLTLFFSVTF